MTLDDAARQRVHAFHIRQRAEAAAKLEALLRIPISFEQGEARRQKVGLTKARSRFAKFDQLIREGDHRFTTVADEKVDG